MKKKRLYINMLVLAILALAAFIFLTGCAQSLFYYPSQDDDGYSPKNQGLPYEDITFTSQDGTKLNGWFVPAVGDPKQAKGTVIQVHGNARNITNHWALVEWLPAYGYNVFVFDYRGYGQSEGKPTPKGLFEDTHSAIDYVRARQDIDPEKLLIIGQSLGGNNSLAAVGAGNRQGICAMLIDSTFFSYASIANDKLWGSGILMNNKYSASKFVAAIAPIPLLFIHGKQDGVIPYEHSQRLYDLAEEPKEIMIIENGQHISAFSGFHGNRYRDLADTFFTDALNKCSETQKVK